MGLGDVLDGAFRLLKANFSTIFLVALVFSLPLQLIAALLQSDQPTTALNPETGTLTTGPQVQLGGSDVAVTILSLLVAVFLGGAVIRIVASSYLGQQLSAGEAINVALRRSPTLLGAFLLCGLVLIVAALGCALLAILLALASPVLGVLVGVLLTLAVILALGTLLTGTYPAVVVEQVGPLKGIGRSFSLMSKRFWPYLGTVVMAGVIYLVLALIIQGIFTALASGFGFDSPMGVLSLTVGGTLTSVVIMPFVLIVATLLYFDSRIRFEGFDLQMIAAELSRGRGTW